MSKHKKLIILDFDGTIANTPLIAVKIVNELSEEFGYSKVSAEEFGILKEKKITEIRKLTGLSWWRIPTLVRRAREQFRFHIKDVPPVAEIPEAIDALHERGYQLGILTSNTKDAVTDFLSLHQIHHIEFIKTSKSLFGKGKLLKKIRKKSGLKKSELVMIGDEVRDIRAAHQANVDAIAVTWGFHSQEALEAVAPTHTVKTPKELLSLFPPRETLLVTA
ncbi:MAG: HAD hydrolase-like protein [Bacteroidota bacterium]